MTKSRAIPLAAQVEAAVERAERAETYAAALKKQVGDLTRVHQKDLARIKELEGPQAGPPSEKPECRLYGEPVTSATVEMFKFKDVCIADLRAKLADVEKALSFSNRRGDDYLRMYNTACRDRTNDRIAREAAEAKAATAAGLVYPTPASPPERFLVIAVWLVGIALGAGLGGLFL